MHIKGSRTSEFLIPHSITNTIGQARNYTPDRGMKLSSIIIDLETKRTQEEVAAASEAEAERLLGRKVDTLA